MSILLRYRPSFSSEYISATYYNTWRTYFNEVYFAEFADGVNKCAIEHTCRQILLNAILLGLYLANVSSHDLAREVSTPDQPALHYQVINRIRVCIVPRVCKLLWGPLFLENVEQTLVHAISLIIHELMCGGVEVLLDTRACQNVKYDAYKTLHKYQLSRNWW